MSRSLEQHTSYYCFEASTYELLYLNMHGIIFAGNGSDPPSEA